MTKTIKTFTLLSIFLFGEISYADIPFIYNSKLGTPSVQSPTIKTTAKGFRRCGREKVKIKEDIIVKFNSVGIENPKHSSNISGVTTFTINGVSENFEMVSIPQYISNKTITNIFFSTNKEKSSFVGVVRYTYPKRNSKFAIPGVITLSPRKADTYSDLWGKVIISKNECTTIVSFGKFKY